MHIGDATTRDKAPKMSAWPKRERPFTEPISATEDRVIGPGLTLPDLIRLYYKGAIPVNIQDNYGFLDRDNKEREYIPSVEDPYVFNGMKSLSDFSSHAHHLLEVLTKMWQLLELPVKQDKDRGVVVPDTDALWSMLDPSHPSHSAIAKNRNVIMFIMANADIMKKACVVRTVSAGWWAVSYAGKTSVNKEHFRPAMNAMHRAMVKIMASQKFKVVYKEVCDSMGFPLDTNPGYPFFKVEMDGQGAPVTRIKTVEIFANIVRDSKFDWDKLLEIVDQRGGKFGVPGHPFAIFPIRRLQPGYKYAHQFKTTAVGLITSHDEQGSNSQRVAWAVSYLYNVIIVPFLCIMKAMQLILPGMFHDGESKTFQMERLRKMAAAGKLFIAEADYSNYDRFIPVDIWKEIASYVTEKMDHPTYWNRVVNYLHEEASLIWPDYTSSTKGNGWVFKPGLLGLLSGVASTTQSGTYVNGTINLQALMDTKGWNEDQAVDYLTQYLTAPHGSGREFFGVQSDDTILIADSMAELKRQGDHFLDCVKAAGLKGSVEFGDRFLMRHLQDGGDRPVPARVWQNTLSNETSPANELVLLAGLASRTDGLGGFKTVDPFDTGAIQKITYGEGHFSYEIVKSLLHFSETARTRSESMVRFLRLQLDALSVFASFPSAANISIQMEGSRHLKPKLDLFRKSITRALADYEIEKMKAMDKKAFDSWIYQLYKDKNVPSQSGILDSLIATDPDLKPLIDKFEVREHAFLVYSMDKLGVKFQTF